MAIENSITIRFTKADDVLVFVSSIKESIDCDVNASYKNHVIDAKSIIGMVELSSHDIVVKAITNDEETLNRFIQICERYKVN